jgi:hypothetical protein
MARLVSVRDGETGKTWTMTARPEVDGRQKRDRADEREVIADKQCVLGRCE